VAVALALCPEAAMRKIGVLRVVAAAGSAEMRFKEQEEEAGDMPTCQTIAVTMAVAVAVAVGMVHQD